MIFNSVGLRIIPLLSKEGKPRSAGVARSVSPIGRNIKNCSKLRSHLLDGRGALLFDRCAPRILIMSALRADFEQTAPPSLREGTPPNLGGEFADLFVESTKYAE